MRCIGASGLSNLEDDIIRLAIEVTTHDVPRSTQRTDLSDLREMYEVSRDNITASDPHTCVNV